MNTLAICTLLAVWGVDAGYEPAADGHLEYIIQISPDQLDSLAEGHDLTCEVPAKLDIRHYRVTVGTAKLPHLAAKPVTGEEANFETTEAAAWQLEAEGEAHPKIHVGYHEPEERGRGECVVEIEPEALEELHHGDIAGDLPSGLPITRFRVTSVAGRAPVNSLHEEDEYPGEIAPLNQAHTAQTQAASEPPPPADIEYDVAEGPADVGGGLTQVDDPPATDSFASQSDSSETEPALADPGHSKSLSTKPSESTSHSEFQPSPSDAGELAPATLLGSEEGGFDDQEKEKTLSRLNQASYTAEGQKDSLDSNENDGKKKGREGEKGEGGAKTSKKEEPTQGLSLTIALALLCLSLGGNVYLGFLILDTRLRCRRLLQKMNSLDDEEELVAQETHDS